MVTSNPITSPAPESTPLDKLEAKIYMDIHKEQFRLRMAEENKVRNDPLLRVAAVELVEAIAEILAIVAHDVALKRPEVTPSEVGAFNDECEADLLVWLLAEYFIQANLPLSPEEVPYIAAHHLTEEFASDWFKVTRSPNHSEKIAI